MIFTHLYNFYKLQPIKGTLKIQFHMENEELWLSLQQPHDRQELKQVIEYSFWGPITRFIACFETK